MKEKYTFPKSENCPNQNHGVRKSEQAIIGHSLGKNRLIFFSFNILQHKTMSGHLNMCLFIIRLQEVFHHHFLRLLFVNFTIECISSEQKLN